MADARITELDALAATPDDADILAIVDDVVGTPMTKKITVANLLASKADTNQTMYIGTTGVAINRGTAALTLAGLTLTTPNLGTPSTLVGTNISGTGSSFTAGAVTGFTPASGTLTLVGADAVTITTTGTTNSTLPLGTKTLVATDVATLSSLTSIGTIGTGTWQGTAINQTYLVGQSGTNTGDEVVATGAELTTGTDDVKYASAKAIKDSHNVPSVLPSTDGKVMTSNGTDWVSEAIPTLNQNTTGSAATLTTPRAINGVDFNGSAAITVTADANTLSNTTLKSTVVTSSLTTVGALTSGSLGAGFTDVPIAQGGTGASTLAGASIPTYTSTNTFTNKRITQRVKTFSSDATPDIDSDDYDAVTITAQDAAITDVNVTGTPTNFQKLIFRIKDDGTARAITWGDDFKDAGVALPTTTVISKLLTVGFIYNTVATAHWGCVASVSET